MRALSLGLSPNQCGALVHKRIVEGRVGRIGTIWDDRITEAYIYDGIDAYIASGRDPMSAVRYANGDEE